jgi:TRAP-type C4-dicarboxylate transport system permease small subunit
VGGGPPNGRRVANGENLNDKIAEEFLITRVVNSYFQALRFFIAACLFLMVVLVFGNVVLRYAFNSGISVSEELSRWLFVWLTFVGAVVALRDHAHLGMDSVVSRLPAWAKRVCFVASNMLMLYCVWLFFSGSWAQSVINLGNMAPATGLSSGWFYYSVGVFFSVMAAALLLRNLWQAATGKLTEGDLIQVRESEDEAKAEFLHRQKPGADTGNGRQA